jgi:hypothetical protein
LVAPAQRRAVERASKARAEHVVVVADELVTRAQPAEGLGRLIGDRNEAGLPALGWSLDLLAERALDDEPAVDEVDVGPAQRPVVCSFETFRCSPRSAARASASTSSGS